jgi:acetyl/propionyl-CoA carboxylase alpha subunit
MSLRIEAGSSSFQIDARRLDNGAWSVTIDGHEHVLDVVASHLLIEGRSIRYSICTDSGGMPTAVLLPWGDIPIRPETTRRARAGRAAEAASGGTVVAPMNGQVVKILVERGQKLKRGDVVLVLEAMKMENEVTAPVEGTLAELSTAVGNTVTPGAPLFRVEPDIASGQ